MPSRLAWYFWAAEILASHRWGASEYILIKPVLVKLYHCEYRVYGLFYWNTNTDINLIKVC